jgi:hypothetical protein
MSLCFLGADGAKPEVMSRDKLSQKGDGQRKGGVWICTMRYSTRLALCVVLTSVFFGLWCKSGGDMRW